MKPFFRTLFRISFLVCAVTGAWWVGKTVYYEWQVYAYMNEAAALHTQYQERVRSFTDYRSTQAKSLGRTNRQGQSGCHTITEEDVRAVTDLGLIAAKISDIAMDAFDAELASSFPSFKKLIFFEGLILTSYADAKRKDLQVEFLSANIGKESCSSNRR